MGFDNGLIILTITATMTSLLTEGIKNAFNIDHKKISLNLLAAIISVVSALLVSAGYIILFDVQLTAKCAVYIIALMILSFTVSTCGYDKVMQMLTQITTAKINKAD